MGFFESLGSIFQKASGLEELGRLTTRAQEPVGDVLREIGRVVDQVAPIAIPAAGMAVMNQVGGPLLTGAISGLMSGYGSEGSKFNVRKAVQGGVTGGVLSYAGSALGDAMSGISGASDSTEIISDMYGNAAYNEAITAGLSEEAAQAAYSDAFNAAIEGGAAYGLQETPSPAFDEFNSGYAPTEPIGYLGTGGESLEYNTGTIPTEAPVGFLGEGGSGLEFNTNTTPTDLPVGSLGEGGAGLEYITGTVPTSQPVGVLGEGGEGLPYTLKQDKATDWKSLMKMASKLSQILSGSPTGFEAGPTSTSPGNGSPDIGMLSELMGRGKGKRSNITSGEAEGPTYGTTVVQQNEMEKSTPGLYYS